MSNRKVGSGGGVLVGEETLLSDSFLRCILWGLNIPMMPLWICFLISGKMMLDSWNLPLFDLEAEKDYQ